MQSLFDDKISSPIKPQILQSTYRIFDNMLEGVQFIDREWRYVYVNEALARQGKISKDELLGHTIMEKYPGIENTEVFQCLQKCMDDGISSSLLNEFPFADGSVGWFDLRIQPVEDGVLILSFDVTHLKEMEKELREWNEELEKKISKKTKELLDALDREKELNQMKSLFVSMASHQFRTPLSAILSSVGLIDVYREQGELQKISKHVARIRTSVKNLTSILNDFLSLDKLDQQNLELECESFNLKAFMLDINDEISGIVKPGQRINYNHMGSTMLMSDKQVLRNIILNLISNSVKYSDHDVDLVTELNAGELKLTVKDRGIGIPEEEQHHLFGKYFRARNVSGIQGTGLGLYIVKRFVELLEGRIQMTSKLNDGTCFTIYLPNKSLAKCGDTEDTN